MLAGCGNSGNRYPETLVSTTIAEITFEERKPDL